MRESYDPGQPGIRISRKVLNSGSHPRAANYRQRYRPAARNAQMIDRSTGHIGLRRIVRDGA